MNTCAVSLIVLSLFAATPKEAEKMKDIKINPGQIVSVQPKQRENTSRFTYDSRGGRTDHFVWPGTNNISQDAEIKLWQKQQEEAKKWAEERFTVSMSNGDRYDLRIAQRTEFETMASSCQR